jgi:hypothetical protein
MKLIMKMVLKNNPTTLIIVRIHSLPPNKIGEKGATHLSSLVLLPFKLQLTLSNPLQVLNPLLRKAIIVQLAIRLIWVIHSQVHSIMILKPPK